MKTMNILNSISIPFNSGWLEKKSKYIAAWRRRWVYLNGFCVYTFKEATSVYSYHGIQPNRRRYFHDDIRHKATEIIPLSSDTNPMIKTGIIARPYSFQLIIHPNTNNQQIFSFVALSQNEYQEWINKLQTVIDIINDDKLMITKVFSGRQNMHCFYVTRKNNDNCNDNLNIMREINHNLSEYNHVAQYSIIDIQYLCSGFIRKLQWNVSNKILNTIQKYVRFELNVSSKDIKIIGGTKYEYLSINIENNSTVNYLFNSRINCLDDCCIINNSMLYLPEGQTILNVNNRLHIDNNSGIKQIKYRNNNNLKIICNDNMIINKSNIVTKDLTINISKNCTMNQSAIITKNVIINVSIYNLNIMDSNIRSDQSVNFNVKYGNLFCDRTGILCNYGKILFNAHNGMIKINGNSNLQSNIYALNQIEIYCRKFILNVANKTGFHPYLQCDKGHIKITTKHRKLCLFNVHERPQSNKIIKNYYWNKQQPQTWLTQPIPIFYDNNTEQVIPEIFDNKYSYKSQLSLKQIDDLILNHIRNSIPSYKLNNDWLVKCISSYIRWDLIFGFNHEPLKTLYLHSNEIYEYYDIKINEGYRIMPQYDDQNKILNINCLNILSMDGGDIILNDAIYSNGNGVVKLPQLTQQDNRNVINLNVGKDIIMRKDSSICINDHGNYDKWKHVLAIQDDNFAKYEKGNINISCSNNLIMEENCSIDSIGNDGGDINIKVNGNIKMEHEINKYGNIIASIGMNQKYGKGGNIMIECDKLRTSKQVHDNYTDSKICSIGKFKNGNVTIKSNKIFGAIANIKPHSNLNNNPSTVILY